MTAKEYLEQHNILDSTLEEFGITYDDNYINIPIKDEQGEDAFIKSRNLLSTKENKEPKYKNESGSHATLFNYYINKDEKGIVICEGEFDCIRLHQDGIPSVTSTSGSGTFDDNWIPLLENKEIYICYDNDDAGKKGIRNLLNIFPKARVIPLPQENKDVCEFFYSGKTKKDFIQLMRNAHTKTEWEAINRPQEYNVLSAKDYAEKEITEKAWLIKNVLYSEGFCFIYGAEGTGKSLIALDIVKSLANGTDWLNKFPVTGKYNVLILDKENPHGMIKKRLAGMGIENDNVFWLEYPEKFQLSDGKGGYSEFARTVSQIIEEKNISLIVIDSFVDFMVGSESSSTDTQDFFNSIRELYPRIAYLGLHHENKPSQGVFRNDSQRLRGSSNISAQLFTAFRLEPIAKSKTDITLKQVKARDSQKMDKFMVRMMVERLDNEETIVTGFEYLGDVEELPDDSKSGEVQALIEEMLSSSPSVSKKQIIEFVEGKGISEKTAQRTIKKMLEEGSMNEFKKGKERWFTIGLYSSYSNDEEVEYNNELDY